MSWKLLHQHFPKLNGWELREAELCQALRSLGTYPSPPPPFFMHLQSHLCPSPLSHSRLRRFLHTLNFSSPTHFLWTSLQGLEQLRDPMKPQWKFGRGEKLDLLLAIRPLLGKPGYEQLTQEMTAALANDLLVCTEVLSGAESLALLIAFSPLPAELPESLGTLLELAAAQVINYCASLSPSSLRLLHTTSSDELLKAVIDTAVNSSQTRQE